MRVFVYPYKVGSDSARKIADGLEGTIIYPNSPYNPRPTDLVINWGSGHIPLWNTSIPKFLNPTSCVSVSGNKLSSFKRFKERGVQCPDWTTKKEEALPWLKTSGVFARTVLNGHSGEGIISVAKGAAELPDAALYVRYKPKIKEYRVHICQGEVIDVQEKRRRTDFSEKVNSQIRSFKNGWVFCREQVEWTEPLVTEAQKAVNALGLDFGAVDIIYNGHEDKYYVLEVNTAPGMEGETMFSYVCSFLNIMEAL
jgi:hypothetical protein